MGSTFFHETHHHAHGGGFSHSQSHESHSTEGGQVDFNFYMGNVNEFEKPYDIQTL